MDVATWAYVHPINAGAQRDQQSAADCLEMEL